MFNDMVIDNYLIRMQTMGNNYYRCRDSNYYVSGIRVNFFEYKIENHDFNALAYKINKKDAFLSSYTIWKVKFIRSPTANGIYPKKFIGDEIDVKLVGIVDYVSVTYHRNIPMMCTNKELNKHYILDRIDD